MSERPSRPNGVTGPTGSRGFSSTGDLTMMTALHKGFPGLDISCVTGKYSGVVIQEISGK